MSQPGQYGPFGMAGGADAPASATGCRPPQPSSTYPPWGFALAPSRCTHFATDGTPFASTANSMYQPGGARLRSVGIVTEMPVLVGVNPTSTSRWFGSLECVVASGRTSTTDVIGAACVVRERAVVAVVELGRTAGHRRPRSCRSGGTAA